ncbi:hypothetical protein BKM31_53650 [[Actinomadura] parvosata subsp. kistnae]|uniref:Uncharacterized protein n=1 Tax=[Actinomadura] parvosata subsp. kistnae TaxID=1909395 RepID=A0A1V0AG29_9ACTN|nr:hypothetical protein [Nonomuraea sp. ATCC 55076]AQZ69146.1 hypothetical protein BKM31_53650 [Nonomuraea sp. ATCC 55076]
MTDRIEVAATELRPLLEEFIMWARANAPESDPELVGPAALWHRLAFSQDLGTWKRADLRNLLLDRMPKVVEDPDAAADGMLPAVDAYLTFLSQTGRLNQGSDSLADLQAELDDVEDEFVDLMEELLDDTEGDDEEDESGDLGDFEPFADELAELDTIRLRPDTELAEAARQAPLVAKARDLAVWVGSGRKVGEDTLLTDAEVEEALAVTGLPRPETDGPIAEAVPQLWNIWNLAVDLEFLEPGEGGTVAVQDDTAEWPFDDDEDVLDAWMLGLHSVDYGDPELDDDDLTMALAGLTRGLLIRLLLAGGSRERAELAQELAEAAADLDELGADAWEAAGDPLAPAIDWLIGYGMVELDGDTVRLTPLGTEGVVHLIDDADIEVDARPAIESMSAHELLALSAELPEEEADAEFAAWMRLREPAKAAEELLDAAAEDDSDALIRVQAASVVGTLGEAAVPAWQAALKQPSLRPYAATHLSQLGVEGAPEPTQDDTHWLILDMWTISAGLGRSEFVSSLRDIGPEMVNELLEVIWKIPHAHVEELLDLISQVHPDKQVAKAARRALFKARSV